MYLLKPTKVYMLEGIDDDHVASRRMGRMLDAIGFPFDDVVPVTDDNLPEVVAEIQDAWPPAEVPEDTYRERMRPLIFTRQQLGDGKPDIDGMLKQLPEGTPRNILEAILGCFRTRNFREREFDQERNHVCWTAWEFGTMTGCPHGCGYCGYGRGGKFIAVALNLEEFIERVVTPTLEEVPWQKGFRMIGWGSDQIVFEPEYGLFDLLTRKMAEYEDRYAIIHTASDNVEWIADLAHRDRIICVWSMPSVSVAEQIEPATPPAIERLEAARFCQDLGLSVRFKFKPIVPIRGWREDYARTIEEMFRRTRPDSVGLCVLMWMSLESLRACVDLELLDPGYVAAMESAEEEMRGAHTGPFPPDVRKEIYRFFIREVRRWDKKVPIYLCTESREMWDEMESEVGQSKRAFMCGCGPVTVPGKGLITSPAVRYTTYEPKDA